MHPIFENGRRLKLYLLAWIPIANFVAALLARGKTLTLVESYVIAVPICAEYAFMCLATWYLCRVTPLMQENTVRLAATFGMAAAVSSAIWMVSAQVWVLLLDGLDIFPGVTGRYSNQTDGLFFCAVLLFLLAVAVHYLLLTLEKSQKAEKRTLELQVMAREAELKALRAQIDPHFLFNSLNSISALTTQDAAGARRMCILLADFLRRSLQLGARESISFGDELQLAENFLDIEKIRFGERLEIERKIDPDCHACQVPPLLIQPLIENAVTHGIAPLVEGGTVKIEAQHRGSTLEIVLENPFDNELPGQQGAGVGLKNVRDRLANMFGGDIRVDVEKVNSRFKVTLRMPCAL